MTPINTQHDYGTTTELRNYGIITQNANLCVNFCSLCMTLSRVKVKINVTLTSETFTPASVKSKVLAPLHRHECYKVEFYIIRVNNILWNFTSLKEKVLK